MISSAMQAYAVIKCLWTEGKGLIEIYTIMSVPALEAALDAGKTRIDAIELQNYFKERYGLNNLTLGACTKFLKQLHKRHKIVEPDNHAFRIIAGNLGRFKASYPSNKEQSAEMDKILGEVVVFAKDKYRQTISVAEAERALLDFFDKYAGELVLEQKTISDAVEMRYKRTTNVQRMNYLLADFIKDKYDKNSDDVDTILSFAIGRIVANAISLHDFGKFDGKLTGLTIYIDSPVIFNVMGLSGDIPRQIAAELLNSLKRLNATLVIGAEHESEVRSSLDFAINLLKTDYPALERGNRIYFYARENGLDASDLELKLQSLDTIKKLYGISSRSLPAKEAGCSEIKPDVISAEIERMFTADGLKPLPDYRRRSIEKDAKILYQVLMLRDSHESTKFKEARAILMTNNKALCEVMTSEKIGFKSSRFPAALLTETVSTLLWLNNPDTNKELWRKAFLNQCLESLRIRADILRRFYKDIKIKHQSHALSDEDYLAATTSVEVIEILKSETFNDEALYTDETQREVLRRLKEKERLEKDDEKKRNDLQDERHIKISVEYGNTLLNIVAWALIVVCVLLSLLTFWCKDPLWISVSLFGVGLISGWSFLPNNSWNCISKRIWLRAVRKRYAKLSINTDLPDFGKYWLRQD